MFRKICVLIFLSIFSYNLRANETIDKFVKAVKSRNIIQYSTIINMNDESKGLNVLKSNCTFKIVPKDALIGAYYNFKSEESQNIYNDEEYLKFYPKIFGEKIVQVTLKSKKPKEFSGKEFEMNGHTLRSPSIVKSPFLYLFSIIELMNDLISLDKKYTAIILSDTIINGFQTCRIRYKIKDTTVNGEKQLYYYLVAFDKKTDFPVYFLKYNTTQQTEAYYSDFNFDKNDNDSLFSRKAFPSDFQFIEDPPRLERKSLKIGSIVPDWSLKSIKDKDIKLKDLKGTPVLLIFSEIGCAPCMIAIPDLNKITNAYKNIKVISIYPRDKKESLLKHSEKMNIVYDILDNSASVADEYYVEGYPTFFLIDGDGVLKYTKSGYGNATKKKLEEEIDKILKN